jgi:predicted nuclease of restriction endonuclease-like (RecB) superfamily
MWYPDYEIQHVNNMSRSISILDEDYRKWILELKTRYRSSQVKAAVKVNQEVLQYYWELGRDIMEKHAEARWGDKIIKILSFDLKQEIPEATGLSRTNLYYAKKFYLLYHQIFPQLVGKFNNNTESPDNKNNTIVQQVVGQLQNSLFSIPWGHHIRIMDKCSDSPEKAMFYVHETIKNGWSRNVLINMLDSNLYERQGKALTNFQQTLPDATSELAQELTRDPYDFAFTGITKTYNERLLKDALLNNISKFLMELGTGFAYVGREYRLQIGETENFIDLLFYNLRLRCYVVIEVKIRDFSSADIGQLGSYVVACNHILREEGKDNPTIGLLICKSKDSTLAKYALESSTQPIGISEYELERFYPEKIEGIMPTIEELEAKLDEENNKSTPPGSPTSGSLRDQV